MGAGKSTHSLQLAQEITAVHLNEDEWLTALYPDQISNFEEYLKFASRIKPLLSKHIQQILTSGTDVVLDFLPILINKEHGLSSYLKMLTLSIN